MGATKRDATGGAVNDGISSIGGGGVASPPPPLPPATISPLLLDGITEAPLPPQLASWVSSLPGDVKHVLNQLKEAGGEAWLVGGCVRDVMSGRVPREVDVCTTLPADAVARAFPDGTSAAHRGTGDAFGTMSVRRGSVVLEVTTIRTEGAYTDGRRPDAVSVASRLVDDLARRDFTVNAAAVDVSRGLLLDPFGGALDAENGVLKCVGDPMRRLADDGLRVWRAYRFADAGARGLRSIDPALRKALESPQIQEAARRVSRERIWEELAKILVGQNADKVLELMAAHGALAAAVLPPAKLKAEPGALSPRSRGVRAQAHLLPAWRRFHERARRAGGISPHTGVGVGAESKKAWARAAEAAAGGGGGGGDETQPEAQAPAPAQQRHQPGSPPPPTPAPPRFVLALDLEATCDAPKSPQPQEVIEVGAVLLDGRGGCPSNQPLAEFHSHVRPTIHPRLSDFCVDFTGVIQEQVDGAETLDEVLGKMGAWLVEQGALKSLDDDGAVDFDDAEDEGEGEMASHFASAATTARRRLLTVTVGDWDLLTLVPRQLEAMSAAAAAATAQAEDSNPPPPAPLSPPPWLRAWCDAQVLYREHYLRPRCGLLQMLCDLGLPLEGRPHAALADARALASLRSRAVGGDGAAAEVTRSLDGGVSAYGGDAPDMAVARLALLLAPSAAEGGGGGGGGGSGSSGNGGDPSSSSLSAAKAAEAAAVAAAKALKLGRHETRRVGRAAAALGRLPTADGSDPGAMRLFRAAMGNQLSLQLLLEATLAETDAAEGAEGEGGGKKSGGDASSSPSSPSGAAARIDAFIDEWRRLAPLAGGPAPLLDGAALMGATGLGPGGRLGRLKEWLWRLQIERDLSSAEEVRALLESELPWREGEPDREVGGKRYSSDFNSWPRLEW